MLIDPSLAGKSREEMGLEPFVDTKIRSSIMGVTVFISQEIIKDKKNTRRGVELC